MEMPNKRIRPTWLKDSTCDRISSLPDDVLHHIMSFMTAREAVQTCMLSTRWRRVWQSLRCIEIKGREFTSKTGFVKFTDNLLLRRSCVPLHSFRLRNRDNGAFINHPRANSWVFHALSSNVCVLEINENSQLFNLDHSSFNTLHLKTLNLHYVYISALFIEKLFSGCPALEDLVLIDCHVLATKFSSRTLKNLFIRHLSPYEGDYVHDDFEELVIDIPSLLSLHLEDHPRLAPCLVDVSSVITASVLLNDECFSSSDANCNILSALSNVTDLTLLSPDYNIANEVLRRDLWKCQAFNNLKTLYVGEWCMDANLGALIYLLRCSPILEKLEMELSYGPPVCDGQKDSPGAKETDMLFDCEHLKEVKILCRHQDVRVHHIVKIILANARSLPSITIKPHR